MKILVTGAGGFVGSALVQHIAQQGTHAPVAAVRATSAQGLPAPVHVVGDVGRDTDWSNALRGIDAVIHLAARVHVMRERAADPDAEFRRVNVEGTLSLARQAVDAGVRRLVFVSSVKALGETTVPGRPYRPGDALAPQDAYGRSKAEAEVSLREFGQHAGLEITVLRPPLVYGPGVQANFRALMRWLARGWPLPLGALQSNRRSMIALENLTGLLLLCAVHPAAANATFHASDGDDVSTAELLRRLGRALGRPARLVPVPARALIAAARVLGQGAFVDRLCASLQLDISATREQLGWSPPTSMDSALQGTAREFLSEARV